MEDRVWVVCNYTLVDTEEDAIKKVFNTISKGKKSFNSKDYVHVVRKHPDLMSWLIKPKEILDGKLEK